MKDMRLNIYVSMTKYTQAIDLALDKLFCIQHIKRKHLVGLGIIVPTDVNYET